ncbi:MAG: PocR ligand-binding domain-containing protein [Anaerolineae bacterium]|jgi:excisionase family DNA binding protein|nr:PocR ligand-binding domain-containing protein [Anaerolineae bacterium]
MDDLLTTRQLQELLQVDRITIYRMLNDGRLQGFKVGGQWRFSRQAVELWLQDQQSRVEASGATRLATAEGSDLPLSCMQSIQNILADAVGMGALTVTPDGQLLTKPSNPNAFCSLLLGSAARQRCADWWRTTAQGLKGRVQVLTCHAGLRCACGRVDVQGRPQAVLFAGQYVDSAVDPQGRDQLARMAALQEAAHDVPPASLLQALKAAPVPDEDCQARLLHLAPRVIAAFAEIIDERARLMGRLRRIAEITNL